MFLKDYLIWHYSLALKDFYEKVKDFFVFNFHFFSYRHLFRHWISPILRLKEEKFEFSFDSIVSFVIINIFTRSLGFILRSLIILIGLIFLVLNIILSIVLFLI